MDKGKAVLAAVGAEGFPALTFLPLLQGDTRLRGSHSESPESRSIPLVSIRESKALRGEGGSALGTRSGVAEAAVLEEGSVQGPKPEQDVGEGIWRT